MKLRIRLVAAISVSALLLASCGGGGDSSGRTKNSALCYATQEEKDAAVQAARDAFDAAMGGGTPGDPLTDTTVPATEDSVEDEAPSDTVLMESSPADGGGYRRPAVRAASGGDTTVPPAEDGGTLTPEQQQAQMELEVAETTPLCDVTGDNGVSEERSCEITLTVPSENPGSSTCEEVVVQILNSESTTAIEWNAVVGEQVVASGVWDSVSENTKVVAFSYTPTQEENAGEGETTTVTCTGTVSGEITNVNISDDCPDGFVYSSGTADGDFWVLNRNGAQMGSEGSILASGPLDLSTLTPETPVVFSISYEIAGGEGTTDTTVASESDSPCSVTFTSTGISWSCNDGSMFNAAIEDMSNPGVYPSVECASEGTLTVAEGQRFWFNFTLGETFLDGWNEDRSQNEPIGFEVPEDVDGICSGGQDPESFTLDVPGVYEFTANDSEPTMLAFFTSGACSSENDFAINWYVYTQNDRFEYSSTSYAQNFGDPETESETCAYYDDSTYEGTWIAEFVGNMNINAVTNVPLESVDASLIAENLPELAELTFSYTFDGPAAQYSFVLAEETRISITANSNQSCRIDEADDEENGLVDPEIDLYTGVAPWSESNDDELADDDNGYHSDDNCSAAFVDEVLPAGNYFIWVENDDYGSGDTGVITVNSSVELVAYELNFESIEFTTMSATVPTAVNIDVPAAGGHFVATLEAPDDSCDGYADPYLVLLNLSNGATIALDDDSGEDYLGLNCYSSFIDIDLDEGKYLLIVSTYHMGNLVTDDPESGAGSVFELKYGFVGNDGSQEQIVVEPSTDPIPPVEVPPTPNLPVEQLKSGSNASVGVPEGVETMVCTSTCVEDLFALEGVTANEITISVGGESVVVKKGASKVKVPVSAGSRDLVVTQKATDGSNQVVASTKVVTSMPKFGTSIASTSTNEGSSSLTIIVVLAALIVIGGVGVVAVRKKKSA